MRDNWYDVCEKRFGSQPFPIAQKLSEMADTLSSLKTDQQKYQTTLNDIKLIVSEAYAGTASVVSLAKTLDDVVTASQFPIFISGQSQIRCHECGLFYEFGESLDHCPRCGTARP